MEHLVGWMEENPEGKQASWHKDVKDEVFANEEHITVKMILLMMSPCRPALPRGEK